MPATLDLRSLGVPVVQAGMGGVARHELAAAVSEAGGLGTIAAARAPIMAEIAAARRLTRRPIAVNILLPFVRPGDLEAAAAADAIVTFWGTPRRLAANTWIHQCGSVEETTAAAAAGADAVIAQGVEAGGHVRGSTPMLELLERTRAAVEIPVLAAGGIRAIGIQRSSGPPLGPQTPTDDGPADLVESGPLYAGMNVARVLDIRPAAELVRALAP